MLSVTGFDQHDTLGFLSAVPIVGSATISASVAAGPETQAAGLEQQTNTTLSTPTSVLVTTKAPSTIESSAKTVPGTAKSSLLTITTKAPSTDESSAETADSALNTSHPTVTPAPVMAAATPSRSTSGHADAGPETQLASLPDCSNDLVGYERIWRDYLYTCVDDEPHLTKRRAEEIRRNLAAVFDHACVEVSVYTADDDHNLALCSSKVLKSCDYSQESLATIFEALPMRCTFPHTHHGLTAPAFKLCADPADTDSCRTLALLDFSNPRSDLERRVMYAEPDSAKSKQFCDVCDCDEATGRIDCGASLESLNAAIHDKCVEDLGARGCPTMTAEDVYAQMDDSYVIDFWFDDEGLSVKYSTKDAAWIKDSEAIGDEAKPTKKPKPRPAIVFKRSDRFDVTKMEPGTEGCWDQSTPEGRAQAYVQQFFETCVNGTAFQTDHRAEEIRAIIKRRWPNPDDCQVYVHHIDETFKNGGVGARAGSAPLELCETPLSDASLRRFNNAYKVGDGFNLFAKAFVWPDKGEVLFQTCTESAQRCRVFQLRADELYHSTLEKRAFYLGQKDFFCDVFDCDETLERVDSERATAALLANGKYISYNKVSQPIVNYAFWPENENTTIFDICSVSYYRRGCETVDLKNLLSTTTTNNSIPIAERLGGTSSGETTAGASTDIAYRGGFMVLMMMAAAGIAAFMHRTYKSRQRYAGRTLAETRDAIELTEVHSCD